MSLPAAGPPPGPGRRRRPTATARFGSSRRESHDASAFYERFVAPEISADTTVVRPTQLDVVYADDARDMGRVESNSVALVVTSPPYFAGKAYEESLGRNGVPGSYFEYLELLFDVFAECKRVLEPGGRIAVNVANLGRRPYRSLAGDVTEILQTLGLLLRGEVVWWKGRAAGGSCAWGSFQRPANPVLRDVTERIVVASKGRFDRAHTAPQRRRLGLPSTASISREEFLEATTDIWEIPPERATRVGHPAPFPLALPARLIELYTYEGDVVLDPFMGSGSTAVAARRAGRHYIGFETDAGYRARGAERIRDEGGGDGSVRVHLPAAGDGGGPAPGPSDPVTAARQRGLGAREVAAALLDHCGFVDVRTDVRLADLGLELAFVAVDRAGGPWAFDVSGAFATSRPGLRRTDTLLAALGRAAVLHAGRPDLGLVLLTTDLPAPRSPGAAALAAVRGPAGPVRDVIDLTDPAGAERLAALARAGRRR